MLTDAPARARAKFPLGSTYPSKARVSHATNKLYSVLLYLHLPTSTTSEYITSQESHDSLRDVEMANGPGSEAEVRPGVGAPFGLSKRF